MSEIASTPQAVSLGRRIRRFMSDQPLVPLVILLVLLVVLLQILRPGIVNERWIANTVKFAIPLAILAGCQTMTMLTGGIDLSVSTVATMSAFIMASLASAYHPATAIAIALIPALLIGVANGIGIGIFRVHPLIMTLGTSLIGTGFLQVYQRTVISTGTKIPDFLTWLGTGLTYGFPNALLLFVPVAALIIFTLNRTGFGRLLYAVGDNEKATRLSGVIYSQVIIALYVVSSLLAGVAGFLYVGLIKAPSSLSLAEPLLLPSVAAAVVGGTSIFGGRGGYAGTIVGALILTVLTTLLTILQMPEGSRRILFGAIVLLVTAAYLRIVEDR
ncbi:ABC transporter permease [Mesorhizobium sp. BAC0120]|uniref:ABC transporter permease n=1 Tax=Mesorhizobium sp. BAC0120 TaxID=3090670 RepID=UPI00298C97A5|nr:ABC transporter permease [Mesorhizobium sp. BAC0120]MDW6023751.1 ABC transporter permease [Mesorhizobium sp. BAC0120]